MDLLFLLVDDAVLNLDKIEATLSILDCSSLAVSISVLSAYIFSVR